MSQVGLTRRAWAAMATMTAATVAVPALNAQPRPEKPRVQVAVGGKGTFYNLPFALAQHLGFFQQEGIEIDLLDYSGGALAREAVVSGVADVGVGAFEHVIHLAASGQAFRAFVLQGRAPQVAMGIATRAQSSVKSLSDLRGHRIGVSTPGSATQTVAAAVLHSAGVSTREVSFVGVGVGAGALQALRSGQIDAISNVDPVMTMLEQKGDVRLVADTRTLKGTEAVFGGPVPSGCLYAPLAFLRQYPKTAQALAHAMVHSLKWLQTAGPSDLIKAVPEAYLLGDRALYLAAFGKIREAIAVDGLIPDDGVKVAMRALDTLEGTRYLRTLEPSRLYTNEFARRAKDRFKA